MNNQNPDQRPPKWSSRSASHSSLHIEESLKTTNDAADTTTKRSNSRTPTAPAKLEQPQQQSGSIMSSRSTITNSTTTDRQRLVKLKKHASFASSAIIISPESSRAAAAGRNYSRPASISTRYGPLSASPPERLSSTALVAASSKESPEIKSSSTMQTNSSLNQKENSPPPTTSSIATNVSSATLLNQSNSPAKVTSGAAGSLGTFSGLRSAIVNNYASHKQLSIDTSHPFCLLNNSTKPSPVSATNETNPLNPLAKTLLANKKIGPSIRLGLRRRRALTMDSDDSKGKRASIREKLSSNKTTKTKASNEGKNLSSSDDDDSTSSSTSSGDSSNCSINSTIDRRDKFQASGSIFHSDYSSYQDDDGMMIKSSNNSYPAQPGVSYNCSDSCLTQTILDDDGLEVTDIDTVRLDHEDYQYLLKCMRYDDSQSGGDEDRRKQQQDKQSSVDVTTEERRHSDFNVGLPTADETNKDMDKISRRLTNSVRLAAASDQYFKFRSSGVSPRQAPDQQEADEKEAKKTRADYAWFPPSLTTIQQIGEFFEQFPPDKIPYKKSNGAMYRDRQIWYQLPKQDISSDFCNYLDGDESLRAYQEFVNIRNVAALDVAHMIQVSSRSSMNKSVSCDQSTNLLISQQQPSMEGIIDNTRKSSIISQSSLLDAAMSTLNSSNIMNNIKCRRCLMRIESGQLAVVAPKFLIGLTSSLTLLQPQQTNTEPFCMLTNGTTCQQQPLSSSGVLDSGVTSSNYSQVGLFHPKCFTCSTCKEFLVDLVYCIKDNKLYCLRHYGESIRPRCGTCEELIFSDEYSKAMSEDFHVDHFICRSCSKNLAGQRYVLREEQPYCTSCFETEFSHTCEDCRKPIGLDSRDLCYKDKHWHDTCFMCHKCNQSLIDKPFGSKSDHVYCADCYETNFATRCDGCNNPFRAGSKKMEYRGRQWHDSCFCCCICKNTIGSSSFIPKDGAIYCITCYEDKYATRCTKCKNVIISGGVTFRNEPWHKECFTCYHCNKSLAGQRFTTKDTTGDSKIKHQSAEAGGSGSGGGGNVGQSSGGQVTSNAYCVDCYGQLFAKRCHACAQAITGFGGTKYVTFEDRNWHNDCFTCTDCQQSLIGKGFIIDGPDAILCGDCAQAKLRQAN